MPKLSIGLLALFVLLLAGCGGASATPAKKASKPKPAAKKTEPIKLPEIKVAQDAFASVDDAMAKVEEVVKTPGESQGQELLKIEAWLQMQGDKIGPALAEKIKDPAAPLPTRITACRVLSKLGPSAAAQTLMDATASEPKELRVKAIECLGRIKPTSQPIIDKVISLIDDPDYDQRKAALRALASIGKPAGKATERLAAILNDKDEDETIRSLAKSALKAVDPRKGLMNMK